jgi:hypothetical protein
MNDEYNLSFKYVSINTVKLQKKFCYLMVLTIY